MGNESIKELVMKHRSCYILPILDDLKNQSMNIKSLLSDESSPNLLSRSSFLRATNGKSDCNAEHFMQSHDDFAYPSLNDRS